MLQSVQVRKMFFSLKKKESCSFSQKFQHAVRRQQNAKATMENRAKNKFRYLSLVDTS